MGKITGSDLRNAVELCRRVPRTNELGEVAYDYEPERKAWARIVPTGGRMQDVPGGMERTEVSHRMTVRRGDAAKLSTDLCIRFRGQRYEIVSFYPNYRDSGFVEILCRLVVEDGVAGF